MDFFAFTINQGYMLVKITEIFELEGEDVKALQ